jgi:hypothetical protein
LPCSANPGLLCISLQYATCGASYANKSLRSQFCDDSPENASRQRHSFGKEGFAPIQLRTKVFARTMACSATGSKVQSFPLAHPHPICCGLLSGAQVNTCAS